MKRRYPKKYIKINDKIYPCAVSMAMDLVGGKWKTVILYQLQTGEKRFSELSHTLFGITERTLSLQLQQIEQDGLIARQVFGEKPPLKVIYRLTELGNTFLPVLEAFSKWSNVIIAERGEYIEVYE